MTGPLAGSWRVFRFILTGRMFPARVVASFSHHSIEPISISFKRGFAAVHHAFMMHCGIVLPIAK
ncbi:MAG: hypothetical protein EOS66_27405 [Mesorhizobium sp.]|nr:MAG: hypothetical protein EOS66_27405 [Mesorhizobium sp.]TIW77487.1 MAG: hypothetical protein E5V53_25420 [Mesorhizobium sp.]